MQRVDTRLENFNSLRIRKLQKFHQVTPELGNYKNFTNFHQITPVHQNSILVKDFIIYRNVTQRNFISKSC